MKGFQFTAAVSLAMFSSAAAALFQGSSGSGGNNRWRDFFVLAFRALSTTALRPDTCTETSFFSGSSSALAKRATAADKAFQGFHLLSKHRDRLVFGIGCALRRQRSGSMI